VEKLVVLKSILVGVPFTRPRRKKPNFPSDAKHSTGVGLKGGVGVVSQERKQWEHGHPVRVDTVGSTYRQPSLVKRERANRSEISAMQKARQKPISHYWTMR
jgi:hypothetical protein